MALTLGDNFSYGGSKPLDARLTYSTLADMKAVADSTMYNGCLAYCVATDKTYQWKSTNTVDADTGRWREFSSGGSSEDPNAYHTGDTAFTAIADGDYIPVYDTSDTAKKKTLWSNIKSVLKTYFDTFYSTVGSRGTPTSGGTDLSLVNTGDMYTWNAKQNALTAGTNIAISSDNVISTTSTYTTRYLTSEQVVGTWIDGKPLYQKVSEYSITKDGWNDYAHGISDIENVVYCNYYLIWNNEVYTLGYQDNNKAAMGYAGKESISIKTIGFTGYTARCIFCYTKTTDV